VAGSAANTFWAPAVGGGGSGTWATGSNVWASASGVQGTGAQASGTLIFGDAAGTVTVNGAVSADAGMTFNTTGYVIAPGSGSPSLTLTGATPVANTITTATGVTTAINVPLAGTQGFTKAGAGTLLLGGVSTLSGTATVSAGTLGGTGTLPAAVSVSSGATLTAGTGVGATTFNVGPATFAANSTYRTTLFGTGASDISLLNSSGLVSGNPTAGVTLDLNAVSASSLRTAVGIGNSRTYTVIQGTGVNNFNPSNLTLVNAAGYSPGEWAISSSPAPGTLQLVFTPVPEPVTILAVGAGVLGLGGLIRRRRTGKA